MTGQQRRAAAPGGAAVAVATVMMNVASYGFTIVAALAFPDMATPEKRHRAVLVGLWPSGFWAA